MNSLQVYIIVIAILTTIACVIPGTFLMLRGIALLSDAISHALLPGIVIMFLYSGSLTSPLLYIGAAIAGIVTVIITEAIIQTKRLKKDAAIGLVSPLFFSLGILLMNLYARTIHLDMDMVLMGELAFTPFSHCSFLGIDCGPYALWTSGSIAVINSILAVLAYKELIITTFDPLLAHCLGFFPPLIYYSLIAMTSITAVSALNIVGSTVVITLMLAPVATAYLLTNRVAPLLGLSILFGIASTLCGYALASSANVSIAGSIACASGMLFTIILITAPYKGLYAQFLSKKRQHQALAVALVCHALNEHPCITLEDLATLLNWSLRYSKKMITYAIQGDFIMRSYPFYTVTSLGKQYTLERAQLPYSRK